MLADGGAISHPLPVSECCMRHEDAPFVGKIYAPELRRYRKGICGMQTKTITPVSSRHKWKKTAYLLVISVLLLVLGLAAMFSLGTASVRFDRAYDTGTDLSPYFFEPLAEGESYSVMQKAWLAIARNRMMPIVGATLVFILFVALNKELLYSQNIAPYVFVLPFLLTFAVFFVYPLISTIMMSFQDIKGSGTEWIGLKNYENMFKNKNFWIAVKNSVRYMVITCAIMIPMPLVLAYLLNTKAMPSKFSDFFKTVSYMPVLCSVVVAGIIFRMMFSELDGAMMNQVRAMFGLEPIAWLKGEWTAMFAMVLLCIWRWTGMNILYYMAGLKSIPADLYEAADIDGANEYQKFRHVILPLLKPTAIYVLTISIYAGLSMFTESYMIFGNNNSPKNYGLTIVGYLYRYGFEKVDKFGFASAVGLVLLVGAMIITVAQLIATGTIEIRKKEDK